jgi:plastocyanin domain-containing protein
MTGNEIAVLIAGVVAVAAVNWWFFLAESAAAVGQEIKIIVRGGYEPATIRAKSGQKIKLIFDRQETSSCSEEIVFPDFGIRRFLPAFEQTTIELTPAKPGSYEFTCGMSMLHGRIIAE